MKATPQIDGISTDEHGTIIIEGPAAVNLYRLVALESALALYIKTKMIPTRGMTITKMRMMAFEYTGYAGRDNRLALARLVEYVESLTGQICTNRTVLAALAD